MPALITAIAALLAALASPFVAIWQARDKSRKETKSEMEELMGNAERLEGFSNKLFQAVLMDKKMRVQFVEAILIEIFLDPERRGRLRSLLSDQSDAAKLTPGDTAQEWERIVRAIRHEVAQLPKS